MDYIRGLKLDVYSHMAGEDPLPYLRATQAVKIYRLNVKRTELKQRVNQQFEKNLQKWNKGIQKNLEVYGSWLKNEEAEWMTRENKQKSEVNKLMELYHIILKQTQRQQKLFHKRTMAANKLQKKTIMQSREQSIVEDKPIVSIFAPGQTTTSTFKKYACPVNKSKQTFSKYIVTKNPSAFKCNATESTKQGTKYERITMTSQSGRGLRGISMKYDLSSVVNDK